MTNSRNKYSPESTKQLEILINSRNPSIAKCMQLIFDRADPNVQNQYGKTLLSLVILKKYYDYLPELLAYDADPSIPDSKGNTPFTHLLNSNIANLYDYATAFINHGADPNTICSSGKTILHISALHHEGDIPSFIKLGVNPKLIDNDKKTALEYLLDWTFNIHVEAIELICSGADINSKSKYGKTFEDKCKPKTMFEYAAELQPELLLQLQARQLIPEDPANVFKILLDKGYLDVAMSYLTFYKKWDYLNSKNETILDVALRTNPVFVSAFLKMDFDLTTTPQALESILKRVLSSTYQMEADDRVQVALALIQHGADANTKNEDNENILDILYKYYPGLQEQIEQVSDKLFPPYFQTPNDFFRCVNIADLRIQLKYASQTHKARNQVLNFTMILAYDCSAKDDKKSIFQTLPIELLYLIINYLNSPETKKTPREVFALADFIFQNVETIKGMAKKPGGVHVMQRHHHGVNSFTLFKSAENLSAIYHTRKHLFHHFQDHHLSRAEQENHTDDDIKNKYAMDCWHSNAKLFKTPSSQLAFMEKADETELYKDVNADSLYLKK